MNFKHCIQCDWLVFITLRINRVIKIWREIPENVLHPETKY